MDRRGGRRESWRRGNRGRVFKRRAGKSTGEGLMRFLRTAPRHGPSRKVFPEQEPCCDLDGTGKARRSLLRATRATKNGLIRIVGTLCLCTENVNLLFPTFDCSK